MNQDIFNDPRIQKLGPDKVRLLQEISEKAKGKTPMAMLDLMGEYSSKMSSGKGITKEERELLMLIMQESLEGKEKQNFERAIGFLKSMGKV